MRTFLYIIGAPGAGKSTLMRALVEGQAAFPFPHPLPHIVYGDGEAAEIGVRRQDFSGTDGLSLSIQPKVEEWIAQLPYRNMMAEGDRLANAKFFRAVQAAGYELRVVNVGTGVIPRMRSVNRARELGRPPQNEKWAMGRETKVFSLASQFEALNLEPGLPVDAWLEIMAPWHPFAKVPA